MESVVNFPCSKLLSFSLITQFTMWIIGSLDSHFQPSSSCLHYNTFHLHKFLTILSPSLSLSLSNRITVILLMLQRIMDNLESLEDLTSLWTFDESSEDVERQLQRVTNELAEAKKAAIEQGKTHKENAKKLFHLLSIVYKERDEARDQLHKLMMSNSKMTSKSNVSSSSSLSSLDNVIASADNLSSCGSSYDRGSATIENLAKGRPRPEKGKLLQSVMEAGPLLDTLLVAGSLPQWRDPPPMTQAPQVPPVPIKGYKAQAQTQAQIIGVTSNVLGTPSMSSTTNMSNFGGALSGSYLAHGAMGFSHQTTMGKRQRIQ